MEDLFTDLADGRKLLRLLEIKGAAGSDMRLVTICSGVLGNYLIRNVNTTLNSRV